MDIQINGQIAQNNINVGIDNNVNPVEEKPVVNVLTKVESNNGKDGYTQKELDKSIEKLNKFLEDEQSHAEYYVHEKFKTIMIKIVDDKTNEVIMEVPPKKVVDMVARLCELVGVIFDKEA